MKANGRDVTHAQEAARSDNTETLQSITSVRPDVDAMALCAAARVGDLAALTALLDAGESRSWGGNSSGSSSARSMPLLAACRAGHVACAALLIDRGASASATGPGGDTPARCCLVGDHAACLGLLLERGVRFGPQDCGGFISAAACGAVACMEVLLRRGADPRAVAPRPVGSPKSRAVLQRRAAAALHIESSSPLHAACCGGHAAAVAWLCRHGASVNVVDEGGQTPLLLAIMQGRRECAEVLLQHGANPDTADRDGASALLIALIDRRSECALLLLDYGASAALPAAAATSSAADREIVSQLYDVMYSPWYSPYISVTGEAWVARARLCARLLAAGLPTESRDSSGDTPLISAAAHGNVLAARLLCAHGASVAAAVRIRASGLPASTEVNCTALYFATLRDFEKNDVPLEEGRIALMDELIERGAAVPDEGELPFVRGLQKLVRPDEGAAAGIEKDSFILSSAVWRVSLLLARWPPEAPLPACSGKEVALLLPTALEHAQSRLEVLRVGWGDAQQQLELATAFLRHVRYACGAAVAPTYAPFAHLRFVASGGLERAWAWERKVHRFFVERVALCRAALQVATEAAAAAAERTLPLLREAASSGAGGVSSRESVMRMYAAARAVRRLDEIRAVMARAERDVVASEAALVAAIEEAEAAAERLLEAVERQKSAGAGGHQG